MTDRRLAREYVRALDVVALYQPDPPQHHPTIHFGQQSHIVPCSPPIRGEVYGGEVAVSMVIIVKTPQWMRLFGVF